MKGISVHTRLTKTDHLIQKRPRSIKIENYRAFRGPLGNLRHSNGHKNRIGPRHVPVFTCQY